MTPPLAFVIEDDPRLADIFSETISSAGYTVQTISDGQEAIDQLAHTKPDLIVLDLHLPHVTGDQILAYIRQQAHLSDVRVMLATADAGLANSLQEKSDLVLLKPISVSQLRSLAQRLRPSA